MNQEERVDLALLYAVGALSAGETAEVDRMLEVGDSELAAEILSFRDTAAETALALPETVPSPSVKAKLMARIQPAPEVVPGMDILRGCGKKWRESGIAGIQFKLLHHDKQANLVTQLVRMSAGAVYPGHHHQMDEQCYVIEGSVRMDELVVHAGDYVCAHADTDHRVMTSDKGCTLLLVNCPHDELHAV